MKSVYLLNARIVGPPERDSCKWLSTGDFVVDSRRVVYLMALLTRLVKQNDQAKMTGSSRAVHGTAMIATMIV